MLRESREQTGEDYDLAAITAIAEGEDGNIPQGDLLAAFAEAIIVGTPEQLDQTRQAVLDALGPAEMVDAAGVAGFFNGIDRVADSTGTVLEDWKDAGSEMRDALGISAFAAQKAALDQE